MESVNAVAVSELGAPFETVQIQRRDVGAKDVKIDIAYCGVCHSDVSYVRNEWGRTIYPLVAGHEIVGIVTEVGSQVTRFAVGDRAGVGCLVDTCGECENCRSGHQQHCMGRRVGTYNALDRDDNPTIGGYSEKIVVDENFVISIPDGIELQNAAPLLCAGVTVYSPLRRWNVGPGSRVAVVGFGGLGHVAVQISKSLGATTSVLDLSMDKHDDALRLGADDYWITSDAATFDALNQSLDVIVCTVPANLDLDKYFKLLRLHGTFVIIGVPEQPLTFDPFSLIVNERVLAGSRIGSLEATQEMMDYCAAHGIGAQVEVITASQLDEAFTRMVKGDVRFRFVLDIASIA